MIRSLLALLLVALLLGAGAPAASAQNYHCNNVNMHPNQVLSPAQVGVYYNQHIWFTPTNMQWCTWSPLPILAFPGVFLVPTVVSPWDAYLQGTPTTLGTYTFSVSGGCIYVLGAICNLSTSYTVTVVP